MAGNVISYRWLPKDITAAHATPPAMATPYGVNPRELFAPSGNPAPNDKRWAVDFVDGDSIPLDLAKSRMPGLVRQFTVADHAWQPLPTGITGATVGEICVALFQSDPVKYGFYADFARKEGDYKTQEEKRTSVDRKNGIARKLLEYWEHSDYRWALVHSSGFSWVTFDKDPGSLASQAKVTADVRQKKEEIAGKLTKVLTLARVAPAVRATPSTPARDGGSASKSVTITLPKPPARDADPDPGSPYLKLDPALRETIKTSFVDRLAGFPEARYNLMYGFPRDPKPQPRTAWEALDCLGATGVNFLARMFERTKGIDSTLAAWKQIKYIRNQWWTGSAGMKVVYHDPAAARACFDGLLAGTNGKKAARDAYMGAMEHQLSPMPTLLLDLAQHPERASEEPPDCDTWREVDKLGEESMHYCVSKIDIKTRVLGIVLPYYGPRVVSQDDIHIDWISPVKGIEASTGKCDYAWGVSLEHWWQATQGKGAPIFTFDVIDDAVAGWDQPSTVPASVVAETRDFALRWRAARRDLAVQGKAGHLKSFDYYKELCQLLKKTRPLLASLSSEPELMKAIAATVASASPPREALP